MSILKNNWLRTGLSIIVLLLGVFFVVKAMETKDKAPETKLVTTYFYNSSNTDLNSMKIAGNWNTSQNSDFTCDGDEPVPCSITVPDGTNLQTHLQQFSNLDDLLEAADGRRQEAP